MRTELTLLTGLFVGAVPPELQAILALFVVTGAPPGHNLADLLSVIERFGPDKATRTINAGYDGAVDALMAEYDPARAGSPAALIATQLDPADAACVLARGAATEVAEARRSPNVTPFDPAATRMQSSQRSVKLTYLKKPADDEPADAVVAEVKLSSFEDKLRLEAIGKDRFDTRFIRNIFFITNVVRILRLKLNRELSQSRNVLVASHASVSAGVTEYGSDPFGPNEVIDSTLGGLPRFNDRDNFV